MCRSEGDPDVHVLTRTEVKVVRWSQSTSSHQVLPTAMTIEYTLECEVPDSTAGAVYEYYITLTHLKECHPLIVDVQTV